MEKYTAKPQINIFDGLSTSRTMGSRGIPEFAIPKKNDNSVLANDLLPLHNKKDDRFQTDIQLNGKTRFEETNTIIKSLEEEIVSMKHKLSFVYEKDTEIGKLKELVNGLKKDNKELQRSSQESTKLRMENKQLKDQLDLVSMKDNQNDKLISENRLLKDKLKEVTKEDSSITDITDILSDSDEGADGGGADGGADGEGSTKEDSLEEEMMDINIHQLRRVLLSRLKDKQSAHIENLINSYNLKKKNKVKKSVLERMLEEAIHL